MSFEMYKKEGIEFPYLIDTRYQKWTSEGIVKEKYERRWVVLISEINSFIKSLDLSYNELALAAVNREDRGAMTIVTATYGDAGLSDDFLDADGELTWWTLSSGVYTYHIKRWVNNDPDSIKAFCMSCRTSYGYDDKEVSVTCNPIAGEPRVMCEATFTRTEEEVNGESGGGSGEEEEEDETETEEADGIQVTSSLQEITLDTQEYVKNKLKVGDDTISHAKDAQSGKIVFKKAGELGGYIKADGWYDATDDNPQAWNEPKYPLDAKGEWSPENFAKVNNMMAGTYTATVPCIHVSISTKKTSADKITVASISGMMSGVGALTDKISVGGASMSIPSSLTKVKDSAGNEYAAETKWLYEGASFDGGSVRAKTKSKLTTSVDGKPVRELKKCYEGRITHSYRTVTTLKADCPESTTSQAI